jgi:hypothetical protein
MDRGRFVDQDGPHSRPGVRGDPCQAGVLLKNHDLHLRAAADDSALRLRWRYERRNGPVFLAYVEQVLVPTLAIVIMDRCLVR